MASLQQTVPGTTDLDGSGNPVTAGAFYDDVMASAVLDMPLQDDAASTVVVNNAGANGTLQGGNNTADLSTTGPGAGFPKALGFDGFADHVDVPQPFASADDASMSFWVTATAGRPHALITNFPVNHYNVVTSPSWVGYINALVGNSYLNRANLIPLPSLLPWRFVVIRRKRSTRWEMWVDGALVSSMGANGATNQPATGDATWRIGRNETQYLQGAVAGFGAWDRELLDDEMSALYAGPPPTITANSLAFAAGGLTATVSATSNNGAVSNYVILQYRPNSGTPWVTVQEGATLTYTPTLSGEYRHVYAPNNDAGIAEPAPSNVVSVTLESPRFVTPLITPLLVPMGA